MFEYLFGWNHIDFNILARPEDELSLARGRQDLLQAMEDFRDEAPAQSLPSHHAWSWYDVSSAVTTVKAQWTLEHSESRVSRVVSRLRKMCDGLHNHSAVLKMLPSENVYVSIISGAVAMITKLSIGDGYVRSVQTGLSRWFLDDRC